MTVKELIRELEQIKNKEFDIVITNEYGETITDIEIITSNKYYGKSESYAWVAKNRECVVLV